MNLIKQLLLLACLVYINYAADEPFCTTFPIGADAGPQVLLPNRFTTRVEINRDGKESTDVIMSFDYDKRKAAINLQTLNMETLLVFDYDTNEIHLVESFANITSHTNKPGEFDPSRVKRCTTFPLSTTTDLNSYFGVQLIGDKFSPKSVYEVLHFSDFPKQYLGIEYVRGLNDTIPPETAETGIACDVWISCEYDLQEKKNFTVKTYLSRPEFSMAFPNKDFKQVPVRTIINGVHEVNGDLIPYEEYHEYYHFKANVTYEEMFQTPPTVYCENRKLTKIPKIPGNFKFSREETTNSATKHLRDIVYDQNYKLIKYEMRPSLKTDTPFYVTDDLYIIHDYKIGVSFTMNRVHNNCSITSIPIDAFDEDSNYTNNIFTNNGYKVVKLKSPEALLGLDSKFSLTGKRNTNGIPTDTYISDRNKIENDVISEFSFVNEDFDFQTSIGRINQIPSSNHRVSRTNYMFDSYMSFYGFDSGYDDPSVFETSECFSRQDQLKVMLTFPYELVTTKDVVQKADSLNNKILTTIISATEESVTRFTKPKYSVSDDGNLYFQFSILPRAPTLEYFTRIDSRWLLTSSLGVLYQIDTAEACGAACLKKKACLSFDHSIVRKTCFLNKGHASDSPVSNYQDYTHFSRNTLEGYYSREAYEIFSLINKMIAKKTLKLPVTSPFAAQYIELNASSIMHTIDSDERHGTTALLNNYNLKGANKQFAKSSKEETSFLDLTVDDCAKKCNDELTFECGTFEYCYLSGDCKIRRDVASDDATDFEDNDGCDVYEKSPLFHYEKFSARTNINKKDLSYSEVDSASDCAKKCDKESSLECRSFNYCPDSNKCFLSSNHMTKGAESDVSDLLCSHYSRDYQTDFLYTSTAMINIDQGDLILEESSIEKCSKTCVTSDGFNCLSFDYCPESKTCLLNKGLKNSAVDTSSSKKETCRNYKREYFFLTSTLKREDDNSKNILTALAISFLFIGFAFGITGTVFYFRRKEE